MESENHRYMPIETSLQEGQYAENKESCSSGCSGDMSRSDRRPVRGNEDASMKDTFYLEHVGRVAASLSETHFLWSSVEDDIQGARGLLCCGATLKDTEGHLPVAEIFAVRELGLGPVNLTKSILCGSSLVPKQVCVSTLLESQDHKWSFLL